MSSCKLYSVTMAGIFLVCSCTLLQCEAFSRIINHFVNMNLLLLFFVSVCYIGLYIINSGTGTVLYPQSCFVCFVYTFCHAFCCEHSVGCTVYSVHVQLFFSL